MRSAAAPLPLPSCYAQWYATEQGAYVFARKLELLRRLLSGWNRRSRSMLVLGSGEALFLESLWEAGFDVTGQEHDPERMASARERMGNRAELALASADHLPFDDSEFDYAVLVDALEFFPDPTAVLLEARRVACCGIICIVPNAWSLFSLSLRLSGASSPKRRMLPLLQSPRELFSLLTKCCGEGRKKWSSTLCGPPFSWKPLPPWLWLNTFDPVLPLGAFTGVRMDFGPTVSSTPLIVTTTDTVSTAK